jgi:hypothetical protein
MISREGRRIIDKYHTIRGKATDEIIPVSMQYFRLLYEHIGPLIDRLITDESLK